MNGQVLYCFRWKWTTEFLKLFDKDHNFEKNNWAKVVRFLEDNEELTYINSHITCNDGFIKSLKEDK